MAQELERDLGLASVIAISVGAMVGSGIFILPALALKLAGPAVILAYLLAGLIVLPAALSKAEMATAMPEAGGTYIYIERSMGPLLGTIAGVGTWFSLTFKGALALVGGAPYIVLLLDLPVLPVAVGLAVALTVVNLLGAKQTGRTQIVLVAVMLAALVWFVGGSVGSIEPASFEGFYDKGTTGLLAATGFVFVSYAGVTKIASVAEEIGDPDRNIPLGMLGSLGFTTALYVLVVLVLVGVSSGLDLAGSVTPMADVADITLTESGVVAVILAAILALISTANAGLLSSSRYPFAMSRDKLAPPLLAHVSERFETPTAAITLTGAVIILLVVGVPIMEIAKLASAFQILVFVLINVALIAFREVDVEDYDPSFTAPMYPWSQAFGIVGGLVLLTQMGWLPMIGAVGIVAAAALWYLVYARRRVRREGVAREELRRRAGARAAERARLQIASSERFDTLVVVTGKTSEARETVLVKLAAYAAARRAGEVDVVRFDEVPDQLPLGQAARLRASDVEAFQQRMERLSETVDVPLRYGDAVTHDLARSVLHVAGDHETGLMALDAEFPTVWGRLFGTAASQIFARTPCDLLVVNADELPSCGQVALITDQEPFEPVKIELADAFATATEAGLLLIQGVAPDGSDSQHATFREYHRELAELCRAPVESNLVDSLAPNDLARAADGADLVVTQFRRSGISDRKRRELFDALEQPTVVVRPRPASEPGLVDRITDWLSF